MTLIINYLSVLTKGSTVIIICILIIALFFWFYFKYIHILKNIKKDINKGKIDLIKIQDSLVSDYYELNEKMKNNPSLGEMWYKYLDSLIGEDEERGTLVLSRSPYSFFNVDNILGTKINLYQLKSIPNYLTGIGITFTFLGLAVGIMAGQRQFNIAQDPSTIMSALNSLLRGASLAFWTSIVGLATSMLFSGLYKKGLQHIENEIAEWNSLLESKIEVLDYKKELYEINKTMREQTDIMRSFSTDLAIAIGKQFEEHVSSAITDGFADTFNALQELKEGIAKIAEKLENMTNEIVEVDKEFFSNLIKEFISVFRQETSEKIAQTANIFREINEILENRIAKLEETSIERDLHLERLIECINESTKLNSETLSRTNDAISKLEHLLEKTVQISNQIDKSVANLTENINQFNDLYKKILTNIENFEKDLLQYLGNLRAAIHDLKGTIDEYVDKFINIDEDFEQFLSEFEQYLDSIKNFSATATKDFEKACNVLAGIVRDLENTIGELENKLLIPLSKSSEE